MASSLQTLTDVYADVRQLAGKDSTTLPDAALLRAANKYYLLMVRELVALNEDLYAEISRADLVSGQREYVLPVDDTASTYGGGLIKLQRVEVTYNNADWHVVDPVSLQQLATPTALDADIANQFVREQPKYWFKDRSLWLAPVPDSTDYTTASNQNLFIYWIKRPSELSGTSSIPDLPKDFLAVLIEGMLYDVYRRFGRTSDARDALQNWYAGIARMKELEAAPDEEQPLRMHAMTKRYD
jgi:hypothetical protein